jgi:hypothetical protein
MTAVNGQWWPTERFAYDFIAAAIHALLDDAAWDAAYAEGRTLTPDQAVAYALSQGEDT